MFCDPCLTVWFTALWFLLVAWKALGWWKSNTTPPPTLILLVSQLLTTLSAKKTHADYSGQRLNDIFRDVSSVLHLIGSRRYSLHSSDISVFAVSYIRSSLVTPVCLTSRLRYSPPLRQPFCFRLWPVTAQQHVHHVSEVYGCRLRL